MTSKPQISLRRLSADTRRAQWWPSSTPTAATTISISQRHHSSACDRRPAAPMVSSTAQALTVITMGVLARSAITLGRRRLSQATTSGPAVPNSISTRPMAAPAAWPQGAASGRGCGGAARSARAPTAATYRPRASSGQRLASWVDSHRPTSAPATMPGSRRRSSARFTWRRFRPPSSSEAGTSSSSTSGTTSARGQRQASRGTMTRAEPKPVIPSTT